MAWAETHAAITAALDWEIANSSELRLDEGQSVAPTGLIFRRPDRVAISFSESSPAR